MGSESTSYACFSASASAVAPELRSRAACLTYVSLTASSVAFFCTPRRLYRVFAMLPADALLLLNLRAPTGGLELTVEALELGAVLCRPAARFVLGAGGFQRRAPL